MTNKSSTLKIAAVVAFAAIALSACSGGEKAQEGKSEGEAVKQQVAPNSMASMPSGNTDHGKALAETGTKTQAACASCHGPTGNAPVTDKVAPENVPPRLAGQYADYIEHSLQMYRDGERTHSIMAAQAATLSDQDIADVAAYFSTQKSDLGDLATAH